jgi:DNA-binding NtrC family response regulator
MVELPDGRVLVGKSDAWLETLKLARRAAKATGTIVLLQGPTGSGKELVASYLHEQSDAAGSPLAVVNCNGLGGTYFVSEVFGHKKGSYTGAERERQGVLHGATRVFFDEIHALAKQSQRRLLRLFQDRHYTPMGGNEVLTCGASFVISSNRPLLAQVYRRRFIPDLFYRIGYTIRIPSLAERREDILELSTFFLDRFARRFGVTPRLSDGDRKMLVEYDWPGNVRQLERLIEAYCIDECEEGQIARHITDWRRELRRHKVRAKRQRLLQTEAHAENPAIARNGAALPTPNGKKGHRRKA